MNKKEVTPSLKWITRIGAIPFGVMLAVVINVMFISYSPVGKIAMMNVIVGASRSSAVIKGLYYRTKYEIIPEAFGIGIGFWIASSYYAPEKSVHIGIVATISAIIMGMGASYLGKYLISTNKKESTKK